MFAKIINPRTNRKVNINSKLGRNILKKYLIYLNKGGAQRTPPTSPRRRQKRDKTPPRISSNTTAASVKIPVVYGTSMFERKLEQFLIKNYKKQWDIWIIHAKQLKQNPLTFFITLWKNYFKKVDLIKVPDSELKKYYGIIFEKFSIMLPRELVKKPKLKGVRKNSKGEIVKTDGNFIKVIQRFVNLSVVQPIFNIDNIFNIKHTRIPTSPRHPQAAPIHSSIFNDLENSYKDVNLIMNNDDVFKIGNQHFSKQEMTLQNNTYQGQHPLKQFYTVGEGFLEKNLTNLSVDKSLYNKVSDYEEMIRFGWNAYKKTHSLEDDQKLESPKLFLIITGSGIRSHATILISHQEKSWSIGLGYNPTTERIIFMSVDSSFNNKPDVEHIVAWVGICNLDILDKINSYLKEADKLYTQIVINKKTNKLHILKKHHIQLPKTYIYTQTATWDSNSFNCYTWAQDIIKSQLEKHDVIELSNLTGIPTYVNHLTDDDWKILEKWNSKNIFNIQKKLIGNKFANVLKLAIHDAIRGIIPGLNLIKENKLKATATGLALGTCCLYNSSSPTVCIKGCLKCGGIGCVCLACSSIKQKCSRKCKKYYKNEKNIMKRG